MESTCLKVWWKSVTSLISLFYEAIFTWTLKNVNLKSVQVTSSCSQHIDSWSFKVDVFYVFYVYVISWESQWEYPAVFSHGLYLGGALAGKTSGKCPEQLPRTFALSQTAPLDNFWRISIFQRWPESSDSHKTLYKPAQTLPGWHGADKWISSCEESNRKSNAVFFFFPSSQNYTPKLNRIRGLSHPTAKQLIKK